MPSLMSLMPFTNFSSAFSRFWFSAEAGMTSIHLSFQTLRPTRRVDLKLSPTRSVEWRRIVATESLVPSSPEKDEIQRTSSSWVDPMEYGSGRTWSTTFHLTSLRSFPAGARM